MQNYDNNFNRASRIAALPKNLTPEGIVENITDLELSTPIIELLSMAMPNFFASDEFVDYDKEYRKELAFNYQILMNTMARIQEYERRTYQIGTDFWAVGVN